MEVVSSMPPSYWETRGKLWHLTWFYKTIFFFPCSRFLVLTLQKLSIKLVFGCFLHLSLHEILTSDIANSTVAGCLSYKTSLVQCGGFNSRWRHRFSFASRFMNLAFIMTKLATVTEWLKRSTCRGFKLHFSGKLWSHCSWQAAQSPCQCPPFHERECCFSVSKTFASFGIMVFPPLSEKTGQGCLAQFIDITIFFSQVKELFSSIKTLCNQAGQFTNVTNSSAV